MPGGLATQLRLRTAPPAVSVGLIHRRRLDDQLDLGVQHRLTLVCAGPGSGKTLALAAWLADGDLPGPVAWLTLDVTDNDLPTFWSDLLGALTSAGALALDTPLGNFVPATNFGAAEALQVCLGLAELPAPVVLVLDDFHLITDHAVLASFERLLELGPTPLRLIVTARRDPVLRLHRLRLHGHLVEIRSEDLAFTEAEAAELFGGDGLQLSQAQLQTLQRHTQGWPAGVRLAAMYLDPDDIDAGIARFSGNERSVAEYLVGEVLDGLSPEQRDFLLQTSVAERICAPLAEALTGRVDSHRTLRQLAAANALVVALSADGEWFSYHPLFRDMLAHRLGAQQPGVAVALHRRAAVWFDEHDEPIPAINHACASGDWDEVGRLLVLGSGQLLVTSSAAALAAALAPAAARAATRPSWATLLAAAACHYQQRDYDALRSDLDEAGLYVDEMPEELRTATEVFRAALMIAVARAKWEPAALVTAASQVLDLLDGSSRRLVPTGRAYRIIGTNNVAVGQLWTGELDSAAAQLDFAAGQAKDLHLDLTELNIQAHLAVLDVIHGRLHQAHQRALVAQELMDRRGWAAEGQALGVHLSMGLTQLAWNRPDLAMVHIDRGVAASAPVRDVHARLALGIASVSVNLARGDTPGAGDALARVVAEKVILKDPEQLLARWCRVAEAEVDLAAGAARRVVDRIGDVPDDTGFASALERVVLARAHLLIGRPEQAVGVLEPLLSTPARYLVPVVDAHLLGALAQHRLHRRSTALALTSRAIDLAQPQQLIGPFRGVGVEVVELIIRRMQHSALHRAFITEVLAAGAEPAAPPQLPLEYERLSERELIVLRYLPGMLKAAEIASDLFVSVNTVKAHNKSIYRKLGATNRREAVDHARAINLI